MITTDTILKAAEKYVGRPYGTPTSKSDTSVIDCSSLSAHCLDDLIGLDNHEWADVVIAGSNPWSPIVWAVSRGFPEVTEPVPLRWHLAQGWRRLPGTQRPSGHAFFLYGVSRFVVLEASASLGGVGWRGSATPDRAPLSLDTAPTFRWQDLQADFRAGLRLALLGGQ